MKPIALKDQAIAVRVEGDGHPVLLLHGLGADGSQLLNALPPEIGYRYFYPDLPGHGDTPLGRSGFQHFADRVRGLMDGQGIERAVLVGLSMGAAIALRLALDAPARVAGLILIRPSWLDRAALPHLGLVARVGRWQQSAPEEAAAKLEADAEFQAIARTNPAAAASVKGLLLRPQALLAASVLGAMVADRPIDQLEELGGVTAKTLVIANDGDPLHPVECAAVIAARLSRATLRHIPSRYLEPARHLAALRAEVRNFLNELGEY
jgi:pimeloyl-ACP methyl ester carboxylesterase